MIELFNKETGDLVGTLTEDQLQFLISQLEEESADDQDYYINQATLASLERDGADSVLMDILREAIGTRDEMELRWARV